MRVPAADLDRQLLARKQAQVDRLRRMLARPVGDGADRAGRLFRLANLELEVAILKGAAGEAGAAELEASAVTCRRLLVEAPPAPLEERARLFLARVELRRGRPRAAVEALGTLAQGQTPLRCQARALAGGALHRQADYARAARTYRELLGSSCGGELRRQVRYKLAWTLMASKQPRLAAAELQVLSRDPGLRRTPLRRRVLSDLILAWSLCSPVPRGAVTLLLKRGRGALVVALARRLLETGKVAEMLDVTHRYLVAATRPPATRVARLRELRIQGLARSGTPARFVGELAALAPSLKLADARLRGVVARATLRRALQEPGGHRRTLLERLATSPALTRTSAGAEARHHLGLLLQQAGDLHGAAGHFTAAAAALADGELRWRARYRLVSTLEQLLVKEVKPGARPARALVKRLVKAARVFIATTTTGRQPPTLGTAPGGGGAQRGGPAAIGPLEPAVRPRRGGAQGRLQKGPAGRLRHARPGRHRGGAAGESEPRGPRPLG